MIATVVFALVLSFGVAGALTTQGQVQSITITKCGVKPGTCEEYVSLATPNGLQQVFVAPDTKIKRAGKPILLGELGIAASSP